MTTASPERKSYEQFCTVANALDYIGDRWTILILRELLGGPARFRELRDGLPGIATNLLTDRLRRMEGDGLVARDDAGTYVVTDAGASVRTIVEELGMWGGRTRRVSPPVHERSIRAVAVALQALFVRAGDALPDDIEFVELEMDDEYAEIMLGPSPTVTARPSPQAAARVRTSGEAMSAYLRGASTAAEILEHVAGDETATSRLITVMGG